MKYDWILFDADNTLLDFNGASRMAFVDAENEMDIPTMAFHFRVYKQANRTVWNAFERGELDALTLRHRRFELFLNSIKLDRDPEKFNAIYLEKLVEHSNLLSGAREMLEILDGHHKMGLITNGLKEVQRRRVEKTNIRPFFNPIVVSDEIGVAKPDPAYFEHTFSEMGHPEKNKVLIVGDTLSSDILGGIRYGVDTCWFNPANTTNISKINPTYEAGSFEDVIRVVKRG